MAVNQSEGGYHVASTQLSCKKGFLNQIWLTFSDHFQNVTILKLSQQACPSAATLGSEKREIWERKKPINQQDKKKTQAQCLKSRYADRMLWDVTSHIT